MIEVTAIKLPKEFEIYRNTENEPAEFLEALSKINIFVGSNNSGKSRFMRLLSILAKYEVNQREIDLEQLKLKVIPMLDEIERNFHDFELIRVNRNIDLSILKNYQTVFNGLLNLGSDRFEDVRKVFEEIDGKIYKDVVTEGKTGEIRSDSLDIFKKRVKEIAFLISKSLKNIPKMTYDDFPKKIYIPTLRGLRPLDDNHTDFYLNRTMQDYFPTQELNSFTRSEKDTLKSNPEIFTGLSLWQRITDLLLGNNSERKLISDYQKFISETLFEGKSVALIPNQKEKVVVVKIGNEKEQPIHHLGDGIQSAIILSFLPFVMQEQTFFFIEEPEMYLHPGLQRKILEFYNSLERHTFFMTTHSNHFLDITIDIKNASIFTFRKILGDSEEDEITPNFTIEAVDSTHESSLELLGVRNSSVFLVNATIWVEGITDRFYFRKMLNSYMDFLKENGELKLRLEEDVHYAFVEYGGANITHWSFLDNEDHQIEVDRLCAKAMVIIDGDGDGKKTRKEALEEKLGERLIVLQCREVENLLPYEVIKNVVMEYEKDDSLTIKDFTYEQYKDQLLGKFIEDKMLKTAPKRKGSYKAESGTIKGKVDFCEKALKLIEYSKLPETTQVEIQKIYQFIFTQNSK